MKVAVFDAAEQLEKLGLLERERQDRSVRVIEHVRDLLDQELPSDLIDLYRERIARIGDFNAVKPHWNDHVGWRSTGDFMKILLSAHAVPLFGDGCGSVYGLDLTPGVETPAVYFFDHEDRPASPIWAAGSSLGAFLLILANSDRAYQEGWPEKWELEIDPDLNRCPRARAIWAAG